MVWGSWIFSTFYLLNGLYQKEKSSHPSPLSQEFPKHPQLGGVLVFSVYGELCVDIYRETKKLLHKMKESGL